MRNAGGAVLVDKVAIYKPIKCERCIQWMWFITRDGVSEYPPGTRRGLKAARTPTAVKV